MLFERREGTGEADALDAPALEDEVAGPGGGPAAGSDAVAADSGEATRDSGAGGEVEVACGRGVPVLIVARA